MGAAACNSDPCGCGDGCVEVQCSNSPAFASFAVVIGVIWGGLVCMGLDMCYDCSGAEWASAGFYLIRIDFSITE